ncbi:hypothetical protein O181_119963 [Austropuccinia psidii MF-1]|uniref:Uncharacterized protein n=1 Tax=Austropuccinia psidii MF-1 TaxID=1389203 RepID=A0A9Q3PZV9_9BASI|nr:hypothetical protein [Austropuccinia psidii MF-1]
MVNSHELGIEVEILSHESDLDPPVLPECEHISILNIFNLSKPDSFVIAFIPAEPPSSQKPHFKSYEEGKTVEPCEPTEEAGKDDIIFSGEVEIISKENLSQKFLKQSQGWTIFENIVKFLIMYIKRLLKQ